jgi:hypothetical protein
MQGEFSGHTPTTRVRGLSCFKAVPVPPIKPPPPGHHVEIVVGRHVGLALHRGLGARLELGIDRRAVDDDELGAERAHRIDLGRGRRGGDVDRDRHAGQRAGARHALPVVAGRSGDDAGAARALAERAQLVGRAAHLERTGGLQVLALEQHLAAERGAQDRAALERRDRHLRTDARVGFDDLLEQRGHGVSLQAGIRRYFQIGLKLLESRRHETRALVSTHPIACRQGEAEGRGVAHRRRGGDRPGPAPAFRRGRRPGGTVQALRRGHRP